MNISIWQLLIVLVLLPLAFLPTIIAIKKNHPHKIPIILVNFLGGLFYGIGWLVALIWCFITPGNNQRSPTIPAAEIKKLYELKEKGILTQEEFDSKKQALLKT